MQRQICFRGKSTETGKWVYGYYLFDGQISCKAFILDLNFLKKIQVDPATVGQANGINTAGFRSIYEGDFVQCKDNLHGDEFTGVVSFVNASFCIVDSEKSVTHYRWMDYEVTVLGNIHDNPELKEHYEIQAEINE